MVVTSGADIVNNHCIFLRVTKMYSDGHYLLQISLTVISLCFFFHSDNLILSSSLLLRMLIKYQ